MSATEQRATRPRSGRVSAAGQTAGRSQRGVPSGQSRPADRGPGNRLSNMALVGSLGFHGLAIAVLQWGAAWLPETRAGQGPERFRLALGEALLAEASSEADAPFAVEAWPEALPTTPPTLLSAQNAELESAVLPETDLWSEPLPIQFSSGPGLDLRPIGGSPRRADAPEPPAIEQAGAAAAPAAADAGSAGATASEATAEQSGGGTEEPVLLEAPEPRYPRRALDLGKEGSVRVEIDIAADGSVLDARVLDSSGYPPFDEAALEAVRRWRFAAQSSATGPVARQFHHRFHFRLPSD
jgi:periplasmic protein TonB